MKKTLLLLCILTGFISQAQTTSIPDSNFEQALITLGFDTNGANGNILTSDALAVTSLDVSNNNITDLTGIEAFTNLQILNCSANRIRTLDLHLNTKLIVLHAEGNFMTTLNVQNGNNAVMDASFASNNQVGYFMTGNLLFCVTVDPFAAFSSISIPNVPTSAKSTFHIDATVRGFSPTSCNDLDVTPFLASFPTEIKTILFAQADNNPQNGILKLGEILAFTGSLDFSAISGGVNDLSFLDSFTSTTGLDLSNSIFSSIDLTKYPDLANFDLSGNTSLASLDASTLSDLLSLVSTGNTALTTLTLPGQTVSTGGKSASSKNATSNKTAVANSKLTSIDVHGNGLTGTLDLTSYSALTTIKVNDNNLTGLNVGNGNNANVPTANFDARNNSSLSTITVDNVSYSTTNWTNIDSGVTFSAGGVLGLDENILSSKISVYPNPSNGTLNINIPSDILVSDTSIFDVTGKQVKFFKTFSKSLNIESLSTGLYILKINTNKGVVSKKIIRY